MIESAIARTSELLSSHAGGGFADVWHEMIFPRAAGFTGDAERQCGDVFARAVLGCVLLDIAELTEEFDAARAAGWREIARREADHVASRKLADRHGGWSYFPDLPELPPDADSLAAALALFVRAAPHYVALCATAVDLALHGARADGTMETWIVAPDDAPSARARMQWGIDACWGRGVDADVLAHFYYALRLADGRRYATWIDRGRAFLVGSQRADGAWDCTWYAGAAHMVVLCTQLLRACGSEWTAIDRARAFLESTERADSGWGAPARLPLETAQSMWALSLTTGGGRAALERGCRALLDMQEPDGSWRPSPWIRMPIGRATGVVTRVATYQSTLLTSAFCLRALAAARRALETA